MDELNPSLNNDSDDNKDLKDVWKPGVIPSDVLESLRLGSHNAYQTVYLHWRKPVYHLLLKLTGSPADSEDITHDVFIKVWENHEKVDPTKNIKSLLYLIARHSAIKHFDKQKARDNYVGMADKDDIDFESSYDIAVAKETELLKEAKLLRMSEQRRTIYLLSVEEGLSADQIAQRVGASKDTVYTQLSAAKKELHELLSLFMIFFVMP